MARSRKLVNGSEINEIFGAVFTLDDILHGI